MIQRIQSLFLFLAFLSMVAMLFFPIAYYYGIEKIFHFYVYELRNMVPGTEAPYGSWFIYPIALFVFITAFISIGIIFLYKNRPYQLRLLSLNILLTIILVVGVYFIYNGILEDATNAEGKFKPAAYFPLISLVLNLLAYRYIKKDEKLVRAADRLR